MIRAIETTNLFELLEWCQEYKNSKRCTTCDPMRRFAIGVYQIYQGIEWRDSASGNESFAASFLHFLMVADILNLSVETCMKNELSTKVFSIYSPYQNLLYYISKAQQMLIYYSDSYGVGRKSRYDKDDLTNSVSILLLILSGLIDDNKGEAFYNAMMVMTGET